MRPTNMREAWEYTVEKVAVNAVMAGPARVLPGDPRTGRQRRERARLQHGVD